MYKVIEVEKAKTPKLKIRGYRSDDRPILDKLVTHQNVIRGIGSGVFEGYIHGHRAIINGGLKQSRFSDRL